MKSGDKERPPRTLTEYLPDVTTMDGEEIYSKVVLHYFTVRGKKGVRVQDFMIIRQQPFSMLYNFDPEDEEERTQLNKNAVWA